MGSIAAFKKTCRFRRMKIEDRTFHDFEDL